MRDRFDNPQGYKMTFILPVPYAEKVPLGRHQPCLHGCRLDVERGGMVRVIGPSQGRVLEQVERFFKVVAKGRSGEPVSIPANLDSPTQPGLPAGRDRCEIIVGAKISIVFGQALRLFADDGLDTAIKQMA